MNRRTHLPLLLVLALSAAGPAFAADPPGDPRLSEAQRGLLVLGFNPGKTNGLLTPQTIQALQAFQKQQGLPVTGRADDATMAKLRDRRDNNPTQTLNNPKTGAPERRASSGPVVEPHPQGIGEAVGVGGNALPDAPKEFNPVAGTPANIQPRAAAPRGLGSAEAPVPLAAAPQEAVEASRVALPPGQSSGGFLARALDGAEHGNSWLRWVWLPIAGLLVLLGLGAWLRAGKASNPYLARPGEPTTRRREPTLGER
jgi:hypothetical protein